MNLMLLEHQPAAPLTSYVEKLWYCDGYQGGHRKERVLAERNISTGNQPCRRATAGARKPDRGVGATRTIARNANTVALQRNSHGHAPISNGRGLLARRCPSF